MHPIRYLYACITLLSLSLCGTAVGQRETTPMHHPAPQLSSCDRIAVDCGAAPSGLFDADGRYWVVFVQQNHLYLSHSDDRGGHFSTPVKVNTVPETIYSDGENRPKLALGTGGELYISWTRRGAQRFSGDVRFSRSLDRGASFSTPVTVNDDGLLTSHRFDSLLVDRRGDLYLAWLDKRDKVFATREGSDYTGAALYYAVSVDKGGSFSANRKVADHSCECCRVAVSRADNKGAAVFWRHIFPVSTRDHAFALLGTDQVAQPWRRATRDQWQIEACPHHGPDLDDEVQGRHALTWFTAAPDRRGIFFANLNLQTGELENLTLLSSAAGASHPQVSQLNSEQIYTAWKQFDGELTHLLLNYSADGGKTWRDAISVAHTDGKSDHPLLLRNGADLYLSWLTQAEGFRLIPLSHQEHHQ